MSVISCSTAVTRRALYLGISLNLTLNLGIAARGAGQGLDVSQPVLPSPVVVAGIPTPTQTLDLNPTPIPEYCDAVFRRVLRQEARDTLSDTGYYYGDLWTRLPPSVIAVGQKCLRRSRVVELPAFVLPRTLRLAVALNEDSLVPAIVARQLAQAHGVPARAAVLDSAVAVLMAEYLTVAHVQLARTLVPQVDALGATVLKARVEVREALLKPMHAAHDVEAELALQRDIHQLFQHVALDSIPKADSNWITFQKVINVIRLAELRYLETFSDDDLKHVLAVSNPQGYDGVMGTPAPPVTCSYWFNTPKGNPAPVGPLGQISVLLFDQPGGEHVDVSDAALRRLHETFPNVAITVIAQTTGSVGGQFLADHPEQEAKRLQQMYTDSLKLPGSVCVIQSQYQKGKEGHVQALPSVVWTAYHYESFRPFLAVIDPRGIVLYAESPEPEEVNYDDLVDFIRRLHTKFPPAARTATQHRSS